MMHNNNDLNRMKELAALLNEASKSYYSQNREIMSNFEYDRLYDEYVALEKKTGVVLSQSPTLKVGYDLADELPKENHVLPMLSLDKTKDPQSLADFCGDNKTLLSWKMDGLTVVLTYIDGKLNKAVTRGNGITGEVVTGNAKTFKNLPLEIPYKGELILRGEAVIKYSDFEKINESLPEGEKQYKNPRNLCSGAVRALSSEVTANRYVYFYGFGVVRTENDFDNSHENELLFLKENGFDIVEYKVVDSKNCIDVIKEFEKAIPGNDFPSDGLVAIYDDISYGASLGTTAKFPRNSIAFKWKDETASTVLRDIEWSASRTGRINPVAIFDPVELEGTTVSRASVHNLSFLKNLKLGIGDKIVVYKANMIIPQIAENITKLGGIDAPDICPVCGEKTNIVSEVSDEDGLAIETLYCENSECPAKKILSYTHFCSRDALDIEGLSEATLEKFISAGILPHVYSVFDLKDHKSVITSMEGFGEKSYNRLVENIDKSKNTTWQKLLYALGIPGIGVSTSKLLAKRFPTPHEMLNAQLDDFTKIDTVGPVLAKALVDWINNDENIKTLSILLEKVNLQVEEQGDNKLEGKTFVITGSLNDFKDRSEMTKYIEKLGGKVSSSVSKNTFALISNDKTSNSGKSKKARDLGVEIITEKEFLDSLK